MIFIDVVEIAFILTPSDPIAEADGSLQHLQLCLKWCLINAAA
jgi:hypothetical protein